MAVNMKTLNGYGFNAAALGGKAPEYYTPYDNRADNSNFRQWVAQAGVSATHGTSTYGGDRWILDSGTITGVANSNGNGYGSIQLNGTIRQIIANAEQTMTAFVGTISGTATVAYSYENGVGELTITSAGGVLDWVLLIPGKWNGAPSYVPKGYAEELVECRRYFSEKKFEVYTKGNTEWVNIHQDIEITMRVAPTTIVKSARYDGSVNLDVSEMIAHATQMSIESIQDRKNQFGNDKMKPMLFVVELSADL